MIRNFNNREKENEYLPMEGVEVEKKDKNFHGYAPDDSPRVNESGSKEPILAAQGAEKPDQYTERYVLDNGTEYSTVVTRGKDHMPGVSETKEAPKDKDKSKVIFLILLKSGFVVFYRLLLIVPTLFDFLSLAVKRKETMHPYLTCWM